MGNRVPEPVASTGSKLGFRWRLRKAKTEGWEILQKAPGAGGKPENTNTPNTPPAPFPIPPPRRCPARMKVFAPSWLEQGKTMQLSKTLPATRIPTIAAYACFK